MKFKIVLPILLLAFTLHLQAQNSDEKGNNENKKEVAKQPNKRANQNKSSKQDKNKDKDWSDDDSYDQDDGDKNDKEKRTKKNKVKSNNGQGNAYGKNKNGLEGREFGQERARQARLQNQRRYQRLQQTLVVTQNKIPVLRERIENAKTVLQKQRPKLSVEVYQTKSRNLEEAERKMTNLEKMLLIARTFEKN